MGAAHSLAEFPEPGPGQVQLRAEGASAHAAEQRLLAEAAAHLAQRGAVLDSAEILTMCARMPRSASLLSPRPAHEPMPRTPSNLSEYSTEGRSLSGSPKNILNSPKSPGGSPPSPGAMYVAHIRERSSALVCPVYVVSHRGTHQAILNL